MTTQYFGKYRGKVLNNVDPRQMGRIQFQVPTVLGMNRLNWAMPCVPYAGPGVGFFMIPPVDARVWIEFENGDPDHPIWTGCFWDQGNVPVNPAVAQMKVIQTDSATITLNDTPGAGGILIETTTGMKIEFKATGIEINNGQGASIKLTGPQVIINEGALEVT
jgi:uncharacterized protein involved in type VI secretion and phage assembly